MQQEKLREYVWKGYYEQVQHILKSGQVNCTAESNVAIRLATKYGHTDIVQLLMQYGADPTCCDHVTVAIAARSNHVDTLRFLLQHGADCTIGRGRLALGIASMEGYTDSVWVLLSHGAIVTGDGCIAIHYAYNYGHMEVLYVLFRYVTLECLDNLDTCIQDEYKLYREREMVLLSTFKTCMLAHEMPDDLCSLVWSYV